MPEITKNCPFAISDRQHLRPAELACYEETCAIWAGDKCGFLASAEALIQLAAKVANIAPKPAAAPLKSVKGSKNG